MPLSPQENLTVRVNIIVPQRADGTGNFQENDKEIDFVWKKMFEQVNKLWSNIKNPGVESCYAGDLFIPDTYIRFVHNATIYYQDDRFWDADNGSGCPRESNWWLNEIEEEIKKDPRYENAINVYLPTSAEEYEKLISRSSETEPKSTPPCSEMPTQKNLDRSSRINLAGTYNKFWWMKNVVVSSPDYNKNSYDWDPTIRQWFYSTAGHTLAHELGHSLGLGHGNEHHKRNKCEFSLMHQGHNKPHNYLPPTEIGKIHRAIRLTNVRNFLQEDVYSTAPLVISEDAVIDISHKSYEDIIVEAGVTLRVTCELIMPDQGKVIVKKGGTLILDGGIIRGRTADREWTGLDIAPRRGCFLKKKSKRVGGTFLIENGGQVLGCQVPQS
jgi:hypothetical protein